MALPKDVRNIIYRLRLPEMLLVWIYWATFLLALIVAVLFIKNPLGTAILLTALFIFGAVLSYKAYKLAIKNLSKSLSYGRLESIVTNLEDAVMAYDDNFKILLFNSTAEAMFGLTKEQVLGQIMGPERVSDNKFTLLIQTLFPSLAPAVVGRSESGKFPQVVDITFSNPDREFRVSTDRILNKDGTLLGFVKLVRDRTREVQLIKSKSDFVSVAAHQLRTPLTAINWTLEGLSKNTKLSEEDKNLAQNGLTATTNLLKTVNDLLNTAEIEDGRFGYKYQAVDLIKFIDDILANAQVVSK